MTKYLFLEFDICNHIRYRIVSLYTDNGKSYHTHIIKLDFDICIIFINSQLSDLSHKPRTKKLPFAPSPSHPTCITIAPSFSLKSHQNFNIKYHSINTQKPPAPKSPPPRILSFPISSDKTFTTRRTRSLGSNPFGYIVIKSQWRIYH